MSSIPAQGTKIPHVTQHSPILCPHPPHPTPQKTNRAALENKEKNKCRKGFAKWIYEFMPQWFLLAAGFISLFHSPQHQYGILVTLCLKKVFKKAHFFLLYMFIFWICEIKTHCGQGSSNLLFKLGTIIFTFISPYFHLHFQESYYS